MKICRAICLVTSFLTASVVAEVGVVQVSPARHSLSATADGEIRIEFSQPLDPTTVSPGTVRAFGRWTGPIDAASAAQALQAV